MTADKELKDDQVRVLSTQLTVNKTSCHIQGKDFDGPSIKNKSSRRDIVRAMIAGLGLEEDCNDFKDNQRETHKLAIGAITEETDEFIKHIEHLGGTMANEDDRDRIDELSTSYSSTNPENEETDVMSTLTMSDDGSFFFKDDHLTKLSDGGHTVSTRCSTTIDSYEKDVITCDSYSKSIKGRNRRITFGLVHVRHYEIILSDHPDTRGGPSIGLGWRYIHGGSFKLKHWETRRHRIRTGYELVFTRGQREDLLRHVGYLDDEIAAMVRVTYKTRCQRRQTIQNLGFADVEENVEKIIRKTCSVFMRLGKKKGLKWDEKKNVLKKSNQNLRSILKKEDDDDDDINSLTLSEIGLECNNEKLESRKGSRQLRNSLTLYDYISEN